MTTVLWAVDVLLGLWAVVATILATRRKVAWLNAVSARNVAYDARNAAEDRAFTAITRAQSSDVHAELLALSVMPLIEKTDWMTGRWNGQFERLVEFEKIRNDKVDTARRHLWTLPVIQDTIAREGVAPHIDVKATTPEDRAKKTRPPE